MANNDPFVDNATGGMAGDSDTTPTTPDNDATPAPSGSLSGRGFTISWSAGDPSPSLLWNRTYSTDNSSGDSLSPNAMRFLGRQCLPHMTDGKLPCFTEFICANGHMYRAHPSVYNGEPWNDHAMVKWHGYAYPLPGLIHAFVDLRQLPPGARINLRESGQPSISAAGVYAVIHSFSPLDNERDFSNTMIGHYKLDRHGHQGSEPTLYMVDANNLVAPTVGIRDVGRSEGSRVEDEHFLFLFRRKDDWVSSWDSMINKCHQSRDSPTDESEYEDDANDDLNTEVDEEGSDEEEEDCSDNDNSNEADADDEEEEEGDEEEQGADEADADDEEEEEEGAHEELFADEEVSEGKVSDEEVVCPPPTKRKKQRR